MITRKMQNETRNIPIASNLIGKKMLRMLIRHHCHGETVDSLAAEAGIHRNTLSSRLFIARQKLRIAGEKTGIIIFL